MTIYNYLQSRGIRCTMGDACTMTQNEIRIRFARYYNRLKWGLVKTGLFA